MNYLNNKMS